MPLNHRRPSGHVVVTPHGQTVEATGGGLAPADAVDAPRQYRPVTVVSDSLDLPPPKGGITGYTGFIPGSQYMVGTNYRHVADTCLTDLERSSRDRQDRRDQERSARSVQDAGAARADLASSPAASQVDNKYSRYSAKQYVPQEVIPISGYGGFVPKARSTSMGVGKPFARFADEGFTALHDQVERYRHTVPA